MKKIFFILLIIMSTSVVLSASKLELYEKACDNGNPAGCYNIGAMYATGNK
jgi:TPR repeat protein